MIGSGAIGGIQTKLVQSLSASLASGVFISGVFLDRTTGTNHNDRSCRRRIGICKKIRVDFTMADFV